MKNLTIGSEKLKQEILCLFENLVTAAGDEVDVDVASKVVHTLEGLVRNLRCTFPKSSKQTWIW